MDGIHAGREDLTYSDIAKQAEALSYRDKLRLAQLLIQMARKQEEEQNPDRRGLSATPAPADPEMLQHVAERLRKLKAGKKESVLNSIGAMFQFQGGVSDPDKERLFADLVEKKYLNVGENGRITYPAQ
jgi:hypothetical protein